MKKIIFTLLISILIITMSHAQSAYGDPIKTTAYEISREKVERTIKQGNIFEDSIEIENLQNVPLKVSFSLEGDTTAQITLNQIILTVEPKNSSQMKFQIKATSLGTFSGKIILSGGISETIPVNLSIVENSFDPLLLINVNPLKKKFFLSKNIEFKIDITKIKQMEYENISFIYNIINPNNQTIKIGEEVIETQISTQFIKKIPFPENSSRGQYTLQVLTTHDNRTITSEAIFLASISFLSIKLFGFLSMWVIILIGTLILMVALTIFLIRRHIANSKKYKMTLDMKTLPKKNKGFLWLGKIAEKRNFAYLDPHRLTTHTIVAGATGGGKSIAAQVLIEEAIKQNICVIVFDPTAQWSGMLRKLEDKKMLAYYSDFGMKQTDARGFPGNIRAVKDARQVIEVEKFFEPGHIQIFTLNKLQPKDMDIFIANIIRQIFKSDPKEHPTLRTLLVFDEIHRILPKFGGSGEGFVQIERACREFRKWGYGVTLISQVLSDFAGQIKANISTEIQMRTRDEGDLNRIKTKYGDEFLQSLVKASTGVGMFVNPAYNHANPYFINFRPILHNTRRLSDEDLEKYNKYNDQVDDLEYQVEQLEELKIDVFDLKMELKLVKDKIMVGNFSVVDIYLEGLTPRIAKQWEKLGKKPKKKQIELVSLDEIKKSVAEAQKESKKAKAKEAAEEKTIVVEKKDPMEELENKQVTPLTLDNGIMISSLKELKTVLPNLDDEIFKLHVNKQKNEIATWFEQLSKTFGAKLKSIIDKTELTNEIENFEGDKPPKAPEPQKSAEPKAPAQKPTPTKPKAPAQKPTPTKPKAPVPKTKE
jgi:Helicase HerA, central domain